MPRFGPVTRRELISHLRELGFSGPRPGGRHEFMVRGELRLPLPNPHQHDISVDLLHRLLKEAGITREEWERLP